MNFTRLQFTKSLSPENMRDRGYMYVVRRLLERYTGRYSGWIVDRYK